MPTCPTCRTRYPHDVTTCEADGDTLLPDESFVGADPDLAVGQRVGEYDIEAKIGEGGFGSVYRAVHPLIGKAAAIKVLNRQYSSNPQMVSRFIAEARAVNQIRNRNIIDIFAFGQLDDGRQYYVMELLDGTTLDAYIRQKHFLSPEEAIPIFRPLARAIDAAHAAGIAHRDLKPENIFLVEDDGVVFPKLLDFGIAKLLGDTGHGHKTRTGAPLGTPYYMSPEQCRGKNIDHRTDIYSFGVVVHMVLTGKLPFEGEGTMDVLIKHVQAPPPPMSEARPGLSPLLDAPVLQMLAKSPDARPASLAEALEALSAAAREAGFDIARNGRSGGLRAGPASSLQPGAPTVVAGSDAGKKLTPSELGALAEAQTIAQGAPLPMAKTLKPVTASELPAPSRRRLLYAAIGIGALGVVAGMGIAMRRPGPPQVAIDPSTSPPSALGPAPTRPELAATGPASAAVAASTGGTAAIEVSPERAEVELTVESTPRLVEIYQDKKKLGASTAPVRLKRGDGKVKLTFKASGYAPQDLDVPVSVSTMVVVNLVKLASPPAAGTKPRGSSELEF
jgi:eukaryotic-like serine/threonine-protein kinase